MKQAQSLQINCIRMKGQVTSFISMLLLNFFDFQTESWTFNFYVSKDILESHHWVSWTLYVSLSSSNDLLNIVLVHP